MNIQSYSRGTQAARDLLDRLGWQYDASSFASTAPPEMREEAGRIVFAGDQTDVLEYLRQQKTS